jgi:hypothetical protein
MHWSDALIVMWLFVAWCWNLPEDSPGKWLVRPLARVVSWLGLWHGWNMFAPNPIRSSRRLAVRVEYADGSKYEWRPPGTLPEGYWRAFLHAHHRKFSDNAAAGKVKGLRWSLAELALERLNEKVARGLVPVHVAIVEENWPIKLGELVQPAEPAVKTLFEQQLNEGALR